MNRNEKVNNFLEHHGVKGMKWGVINKDEPKGDSKGGSKSESKENSGKESDNTKTGNGYEKYKSGINKNANISNKEKAKNLAENKKKFAKKFEPDSPKDEASSSTGEKEGWQKADYAKLAAGAAFVGVVGYAAWKHQSNVKRLANIRPGDGIDAKDFQALTNKSQSAFWSTGSYIQPSSFDRKAFSLPVGHEFFRISTGSEAGFRDATYCTSSISDFNRYVAGFRGEKGNVPLTKIGFKATKEIKVPDLQTTLDTMQEVLSSKKHNPHKMLVDAESAFDTYQSMSGSGWDDTLSRDFFAALKKKGFGAIIDEMDAGVIGDTPLVLFDSGLVSKKQSTALTADMIKEAESNLVELLFRKRP